MKLSLTLSAALVSFSAFSSLSLAQEPDQITQGLSGATPKFHAPVNPAGKSHKILHAFGPAVQGIDSIVNFTGSFRAWL
jgi:hypothetical protein